METHKMSHLNKILSKRLQHMRCQIDQQQQQQNATIQYKTWMEIDTLLFDRLLCTTICIAFFLHFLLDLCVHYEYICEYAFNIVRGFTKSSDIIAYHLNFRSSTLTFLIIQLNMLRIRVSVCVCVSSMCSNVAHFEWYRKWMKSCQQTLFPLNCTSILLLLKKIHLRWCILMALRFQLHIFDGCQLASDVFELFFRCCRWLQLNIYMVRVWIVMIWLLVVGRDF